MAKAKTPSLNDSTRALFIPAVFPISFAISAAPCPHTTSFSFRYESLKNNLRRSYANDFSGGLEAMQGPSFSSWVIEPHASVIHDGYVIQVGAVSDRRPIPTSSAIPAMINDSIRASRSAISRTSCKGRHRNLVNQYVIETRIQFRRNLPRAGAGQERSS